LENPLHAYEKSGIYSLELVSTSQFGCKDSIKKFVETYAKPYVDAGSDKSISKGFEVILTASADSAQYQWLPTDGLSDNGLLRPFSNPAQSTLYTLNVTDKNGCKNSDSIRVEVDPDYKLIVYNIITPDGNGENDVWYIDNAETYPDLHLWVFDNAGREVFKSDGYKNDWGATKGGDPLPDGSYYYVITFDNSTRKYKGTFTVLRNL
jgi:gliding motility-associated-like protein